MMHLGPGPKSPLRQPVLHPPSLLAIARGEIILQFGNFAFRLRQKVELLLDCSEISVGAAPRGFALAKCAATTAAATNSRVGSQCRILVRVSTQAAVRISITREWVSECRLARRH